eukprot:TRINITY_DN18079_c0_g1_i1.p1 TRINITY_DN18079_c0_g1~~TRINITY_DN18079_c0_g1_i1.p1  ORF type:complete len:903 (+),score=142.58 TRINITY_DN18079_c0_g1_i1:117-2711(+)
MLLTPRPPPRCPPEETIELSDIVHNPDCPALGQGGFLGEGYAMCPACFSTARGEASSRSRGRLWPVPPPPPFPVLRPVGVARSGEGRPPLPPPSQKPVFGDGVRHGSGWSGGTNPATSSGPSRNRSLHQSVSFAAPGPVSTPLPCHIFGQSMGRSGSIPATFLRFGVMSPQSEAGESCFSTMTGNLGDQFCFVPGGVSKTGSSRGMTQDLSRSQGLEPRSPAVMLPVFGLGFAGAEDSGFVPLGVRLGGRRHSSRSVNRSRMDMLACTAVAPRGFGGLAGSRSTQCSSTQDEHPRPQIKRRPRHADMDVITGPWAHSVVTAALCDAYEQVASPGAHAGWWWPVAAAFRRQVQGVLKQLGAPEDPASADPDFRTSSQAVRTAAAASVRQASPLTRSLLEHSASVGRTLSGTTQSCVWRGSIAVHQCTDPGDRSYMEDRVICLPRAAFEDVPTAGVPELYVGVFDGHAGVDAAEWARDRLHTSIFKHPQYASSPGEALCGAFSEVDAAYAEWAAQREIDSGACALAAVLRAEERQLWTAWLGDCTGFLCRTVASEGKFSVVTLTEPHNLAENEAEGKAVKARGGRLLYGADGLRVEGVIQITRSIGDRLLRHALSQEPQIFCTPISDKDEFIVLGSDGLIEELVPTEVCEYVRNTKATLDQWYEHQRRLIELWDLAGSPAHGAPRSTLCVSKATSASGRSLGGIWSPETESRAGSGGAFRRAASVAALRAMESAPDDDDDTVLPPRLKHVRHLVSKLPKLCASIAEALAEYGPNPSGTTTVVGGKSQAQPTQHPVPADALHELLDIAFNPVCSVFDTYQVVTDALVAEAFVQKGSGRDNTSAVIIFLRVNVLTDTESRLRNIIRGG